jgi:hypothetical protein
MKKTFSSAFSSKSHDIKWNVLWYAIAVQSSFLPSLVVYNVRVAIFLSLAIL